MGFSFNGTTSQSMGLATRITNAVSYTHLDVYKRQAWLSALHLSEGTYNGRRRKSHRIRRLLLLLDR